MSGAGAARRCPEGRQRASRGPPPQGLRCPETRHGVPVRLPERSTALQPLLRRREIASSKLNGLASCSPGVPIPRSRRSSPGNPAPPPSPARSRTPPGFRHPHGLWHRIERDGTALRFGNVDGGVGCVRNRREPRQGSAPLGGMTGARCGSDAKSGRSCFLRCIPSTEPRETPSLIPGKGSRHLPECLERRVRVGVLVKFFTNRGCRSA